jgi:hypothetical protein
MSTTVRGTFLSLCLLSATSAFAQDWSFDARKIGMGGVGDGANVAITIVDEQRSYRAIVLPFGLIQVLPHVSSFNPSDDDFDLVRAIEYAASPIHYIVGRDTTDSGVDFIDDIRNGRLNRDLNVYSGFVPANEIVAEGLAAPNWGGTIKVRKSDDGAFQGIYIGAGPYLSMRTAATVDPALTTILGSETPVFVRNSSFHLDDTTLFQAALAITGGYRARMAWASGVGSGSDAEGLYIGANYHYLRGFRYEDLDVRGRLDTDNAGLLTFNPSLGLPLLIGRDKSSNGRGFAIDVGMAAVLNKWEVGFGVNGIANRIEWSDVEHIDYAQLNLLTGGDFIDSPAVPAPDARVELPVDVRVNAAYNSGEWAAMAEYGHGFNGTTFRGGLEARLQQVKVRGGGRYVNDRFEPTGGVGFDFSRRAGIDVGFFGTSANLERKRHLGIAVSFRLMREEP